MPKKNYLTGLRLFLANLFAGLFLSWYTIYLMKSTVNWWGAGSMWPGFFWMNAFPTLILIFAFVLWAFQKALLQSWRNASIGSLFLSGALFLSPFLFNILPYWQGNLEMPFTLSLIFFGWSLPLVFLLNRQEQEKQILRELEKARQSKRKNSNARENSHPNIMSYKPKTEATMRQNHPLAFFIGYHLTISLLSAFGIAFFILQQPYYGGTSEMDIFIRIWRGFTEVVPQQFGAILLSAGILSLVSFGGYGLLRGSFLRQPKSHTILYSLALALAIASCFFLFGLELYISSVFILIPALLQCLLLSQIERRWNRNGEKAKNLRPEKNRLLLHISYHLIVSLLIAFAIAFFILHGYSIRPNLNMLEEIWRTFSYVFPQWYGMILLSAGILGLFAFGSYGLVRGSFLRQPKISTALYALALLCSLAIFMLLFGFMFHLYGLYIILPGTIQCVILSQIERRLSKDSEKAKHSL